MLDAVLSYLPLYYEGKVLFLLWLHHSLGAGVLFARFVQPLLAPHTARIDETAAFVLARAKNLKMEDATAALEFVVARAQGLVAAPAAKAGTPAKAAARKPLAESPSATALTGADDKAEEEVVFDDEVVVESEGKKEQ